MIHLADYIYRHPGLHNLTDEKLNGLVTRDKKSKKEDKDYVIGWGEIPFTGHKQGVIESGFFREACHFDTIGIYQHCSLNTPQALRMIGEYDAPVSAKEILKTNAPSKFGQPIDKDAPTEWNGIVLACQNPVDRSIRSISSPTDYYLFLRTACAYYGKRLFVKLHPWNNGDVEAEIRSIATQYGCACGKVDHRILDKCEFVIAFNSTFAVDCMLRGVPFAQFAPGYFYQNPAVEYTAYTYPDEVHVDKEFGYKTCDFLVNKYCFDQTMPTEDWVKMFIVFAESKELFPLPEDMSYAAKRLVPKAT